MNSTPAVGGASSASRLRMETTKPGAPTDAGAAGGSGAPGPVAKSGTADAAVHVLGGDPFSTNAGLVRPEGYGGGPYPIDEAAVQRFVGENGGSNKAGPPADEAPAAAKEPVSDASLSERAAATVLQTLEISPESERGQQVARGIEEMSPEARDAFVNMILSNALKINDDFNNMLLGWIETLGDSVRASSDKSSDGLND